MKSAGKWRRNSLLVLEGVVPLGVGHGARVEPHVHHLGRPAHGAAARRAGPRELVDEGPVRVEVVGQRPAQPRPAPRSSRSTDVLGSRRHNPHRQRRAPVAVPGQGPVHVAPRATRRSASAPPRAAATAPARCWRSSPPGTRWSGEPGVPRHVDERGAAAPAVRVAVDHVAVTEDAAPRRQVSTSTGSASFTNIPPTSGRPPQEAAGVVHRAQHGQAVALPRRVVVGAERGRHVHDAGAVLGADEVLQHHRSRPAPRSSGTGTTSSGRR